MRRGKPQTSLLVVAAAVVLGVLISATSALAIINCPPTCTGTPSRDVMQGDNTGNNMDALGSNDDVYGGGGFDDISGSGGANDFVYDTSGNDVLRGGDGASDYMYAAGDSGSDTLKGGAQAGDKCEGDLSDSYEPDCEIVTKH